MKFIISYFCFQFKNIFKSKSLISVLFIGPLIYASLYPQPYVNEVMRQVPIGVVDQDNSLQSLALIKDLNATDTLKVVNQFEAIKSAEEALNKQQIFGFLVIPPSFEHDLVANKPTSLPFFGDASYILIYNNMATTVSTVVANLSSQNSIKKQIAQGVDPAVAKGNTLSFTPTMIPLFNPQSGYATYIIPPAFMLILHQLLIVGIIIYTNLHQKKEKIFVLKQIKKDPASKKWQLFYLLIGKWLAYLCIYFILFWIYFIFIHLIYDIPNLASFVDLCVFSLLYFSATIFFALTCSTFIKRLDALFILYVPISIILFFMAGISWPADLIFKPFLWIAHLIPAVTGMGTSTQLSQLGAPLSMISGSLYLLFGLFCFYFIVTFCRLKKYFSL